MKIKGVDYDLGNSYIEGHSTRPTFDPAIVKRQIEIIKNDLHCNAIRLNGKDIERLTFAGECALDQGLQVWFLPRVVDATEQATLTYLAEASVCAMTRPSPRPPPVTIATCPVRFTSGISKVIYCSYVVFGDDCRGKLAAIA